MFLCAIPIIYNIDFILCIWLVEIPKGASIFAILFIMQGVVNSLSTPLNFCIVASGEIKYTQIWSSIVYIFDLVLLYVLFYCGFPPATAAVVKLFVVILDLFVRLHFACKYLPTINERSYWTDMLLPLMANVLIIVFIYILFKKFTDGIVWDFVATILLIIASLLSSFFVTLDSYERRKVEELLNSKLRKIMTI